MQTQTNSKKTVAFSLVEILVALALLSIVSAVAYGLTGEFRSAVKTQRLEADVAALNSALLVYEANGGQLENMCNASEVISQLKTKANTGQFIPGLGDSMVDERLSYISNKAPKGLRAQWDSKKKRFVLSTVGPGITEFTMDGSLTKEADQFEDRQSNLRYAKNDNWVWDYKDRNTQFPFTAPVTVPDEGTSVPTPNTSILTLNPPVFSLPNENTFVPGTPIQPGDLY